MTLNEIWEFASALVPSFSISNMTRIERERTSFEECFIDDSRLQELIHAIQVTSRQQAEFLRCYPTWIKPIFILPAELRLRIAQFAWPCAYQYVPVLTSETQRLLEHMKATRVNRLRETRIHFQREIYAIRFAYAGISYISGFQCTPSSGSQLIWKGAQVQRVIVALDEMGVIDIRFLEKGSETIDPPLKKAGWYKVLSAASKDSVSEMAVQSNVHFSRSDLFSELRHN